MKKHLVHVVWIVVAIVAFVGGMYYGKATASPFGAAAGRFGNFAGAARNGGNFAGRAGGGGGFVAGRVVSKDAQSITIALPDGSSKIVFYSTSTEITIPSAASASDIATGTEVAVGGTANPDGSLTAQTIQVRQNGGPGGVPPASGQ